MKKEFKMKKTLALVMALSVAATAAANFSAFALDPETRTTELTLTPNTASYTLTIPAAITLKERATDTLKGEADGKYIATNEENNDVISVSDMNKLSKVEISVTASSVTDGSDEVAIGATEGDDKKTLRINLSGFTLTKANAETAEYNANGSKDLIIKTEEYDTQISETYKGQITFTATPTE